MFPDAEPVVIEKNNECARQRHGLLGRGRHESRHHGHQVAQQDKYPDCSEQRNVALAPCPTISSSRSLTPTPIGLVMSNSMHCCAAGGWSAEIRGLSHKKKITAKRKVTSSMAKKFGMGYCGFEGWMCRNAKSAAAGLPSSQFTALVTPRMCSCPIHLPEKTSAYLFISRIGITPRSNDDARESIRTQAQARSPAPPPRVRTEPQSLATEAKRE